MVYPCPQLHTADMSLAYTGCGDRPGRCSNIHAAAALPRHQQLLSPGTTYTVRVQIRNKFGVSESLHVPVVTLLEPIKQLAETKVKEDTEERNEAILAMIIGGLVTLVMLVLV